MEKLALYDERMALPDNVTGEIVAGRLYAQPQPADKHTFDLAALWG